MQRSAAPTAMCQPADSRPLMPTPTRTMDANHPAMSLRRLTGRAASSGCLFRGKRELLAAPLGPPLAHESGTGPCQRDAHAATEGLRPVVGHPVVAHGDACAPERGHRRDQDAPVPLSPHAGQGRTASWPLRRWGGPRAEQRIHGLPRYSATCSRPRCCARGAGGPPRARWLIRCGVRAGRSRWRCRRRRRCGSRQLLR